MPGWFRYPGYLIAAAASAFVLWQLVRFVRERGGQRFFAAHDAVMWLYAVGLGCKVAGLGPEFFRFYLADVGFPLVVAEFIWRPFSGRYVAPRTSRARPLRASIASCRARAWTIVAALALSYGYEVMSDLLVGMAKQNYPDAHIPVGRFDWWDIAAYTAGGLYGIVLCMVWWGWLRGNLAVAEAADQADAEAARQASRQRRVMGEDANRRRRRKGRS